MLKDILDLLPERELAMIENAGYALLHKHGYKVRGARHDGRVRARIKRALVRRGHELGYSCRKGEESGGWRICFVLRRVGGEVIDRTQTFQIIFGGRKRGAE